MIYDEVSEPAHNTIFITKPAVHLRMKAYICTNRDRQWQIEYANKRVVYAAALAEHSLP